MALAKFQIQDWIGGFLTSVGGKSAFTVATTPTDSSGNEYGVSNPMPVTSTSAGGASNIATGQVSVTAVAAPIVASRSGRRAVLVTNLGTTDVYLGGSGVTSTTGQLLAGTKGTTASLEFTGALYGITASGSQSVSFTEIY